MRIGTFSLFVVSAFLLIGAFAISWLRAFGGPPENHFVLGVLATLSFAFGMAGLFMGFAELKSTRTMMTWIGIIGNSTIIIAFIVVVIVARKMQENRSARKFPIALHPNSPARY